MLSATSSSAFCLNEDAILSLLAGRLEGRVLDETRAHLDRCASCQEILALMLTKGASTLASGPRPAGDPLRLAPGAAIGRYTIEREIGAGAMGVVYLAQDGDLDRKVALKTLHGQTDETAARLRREAQALARLSHPNVIGVHEVGTHEDQVFMAMEFVQGSSLTEWLGARDRSIPEIVDVFVQAGRGLAVAHAAGLVHRDFKPDNVLVGDDGRVRVVDFGLARRGLEATLAGSHARPPQDVLRSLTREGALVGTPAYMAPEQLAGGAADARTDQFGFGIALFEALFHVRPFHADSVDGLASAIASGAIVRPRGARVPPALEAVVLRALRPDPRERFATMDELLVALVTRPRPRRIAPIAIAIAAFLALGAVVALRPSPPVARAFVAHVEMPRVVAPEALPIESAPATAAPARPVVRARAAAATAAVAPPRAPSGVVAAPVPTTTTRGPNGAPIVD